MSTTSRLKPHTFDDLKDDEVQIKEKKLKPHTFEDEIVYKDNTVSFSQKVLTFLASIWGLFFAIMFFIIMIFIADFILSIRNTIENFSLWSMFYIVASVVLLFVVALHIYKIFSQIKSLKDANELKKKYAYQKKSLNSDIVNLSSSLVEQYKNTKIKELDDVIIRLNNKLNTSPVHDELYKLNEEVYYVIDKKAQKIIKNASIQSALATAASPIAFLDMFLTFYRTVYLVNEISSLYGYKPGFITKYSILKQTLFNIAFAGSSEKIMDYIPEIGASSSLNILSKSLAQGLANAVLMLRVGNSINNACSPIKLDNNKLDKSIINTVIKIFKDKKREEN